MTLKLGLTAMAVGEGIHALVSPRRRSSSALPSGLETDPFYDADMGHGRIDAEVAQIAGPWIWGVPLGIGGEKGPPPST